MKVVITGRHISVSDRLQDYTEKKVVRLEKYFHQLMEIKVMYHTEKLDKICEIIILADGAQFLGIEKAGDFYSAFDLLLDKIEMQAKKYKNKHQEHKGIHMGELPVIDLNADESMEVTVINASAKPSDEIEAYLQLKAESDFFRLYKRGGKEVDPKADYKNLDYAMIYKGENGLLRLVEIPVEKLSADNAVDHIKEYDVEIVKDSWTNPEMKKSETTKKDVKAATVSGALNTLFESDKWFVPFYNSDSKVLNILYRRGKRVELLVPAGK